MKHLVQASFTNTPIDDREANALRRALDVFRIGVAGALLCQLAMLWPDLPDIYLGGVARPEVLETSVVLTAISRVSGLNPATVLLGIFLLYGAALVGILANKGARAAAIVALLCHFVWVNSAPCSSYGVDSFARVSLFLLCLAPSRNVRGVAQVMLLLVAFLSIVYGSAGIHKSLGPEWWSGESFHRMLYFQVPAWGDWVAHHPAVAVALSAGTVLLDLAWPLFIWIRPLRQPVLIVTILMHVGIVVTLGLVSFAAIMVVLNGAVLVYTLLAEGALLPFRRVRKKLEGKCETPAMSGV